MPRTSPFPTPRSALATSAAACAAIAAILAVLGGNAISAQDNYTVQVPDGLGFSSSLDLKTGRLLPSVSPGT